MDDGEPAPVCFPFLVCVSALFQANSDGEDLIMRINVGSMSGGMDILCSRSFNQQASPIHGQLSLNLASTVSPNEEDA